MTAKIVKLDVAKPPSRLQSIRSSVNAAANTLTECQRYPGFCAAAQMTRVLFALSSAIHLIDNEIEERGE